MPRKLAPMARASKYGSSYPTSDFRRVVLRAPATGPAARHLPAPAHARPAGSTDDAPDDKVTSPAGRTARYTTGARSRIIQRDPRGRGERWSLSMSLSLTRPFRVPFKQLRVVATPSTTWYSRVTSPGPGSAPGVKRLRNRNSYTEPASGRPRVTVPSSYTRHGHAIHCVIPPVPDRPEPSPPPGHRPRRRSTRSAF